MVQVTKEKQINKNSHQLFLNMNRSCRFSYWKGGIHEQQVSCVNSFLFILFNFCILTGRKFGGSPRGVMVKAMDCGIVVSEFVLQSRYYVHFRANTPEKGMKPLILSAMD